MDIYSIVPPIPLEHIIDHRVQALVEGWIAYLKKMSSRIIVRTPTDPDFDFLEYERGAKLLTSASEDFDNITLFGWPKIHEVAFIVGYNCALPFQDEKVYMKNCYLFCYGRVAFGLDYFERVEEDIRSQNRYEFSLDNYPDTALTWEYITSMIRRRIEEIENSVPPLPESQTAST